MTFNASPKCFKQSSFIFAILLVAIMKPSIESVDCNHGKIWPAVARLVRGEFLALKNREFVQACHTLGMGDVRIMLAEYCPLPEPDHRYWFVDGGNSNSN